jgi:predicted alpha/beta hydrolase family esterase
MARESSDVHVKAVALALFQIRVLLSAYLGSENDGDPSVRQAAHLAYALHNEALALLEGGNFDAEAVVRRLAAVDEMLSSEFRELFARVLPNRNASSTPGSETD